MEKTIKTTKIIILYIFKFNKTFNNNKKRFINNNKIRIINFNKIRIISKILIINKTAILFILT